MVPFPPQAARALPVRPPTPTAGRPPLRVLIIEDDAEAAQHMADDLADFGVETAVVNDGAAALAPGLGDGAFDVLIIDRMLPGCDGLELLRQLRGRGVDTPALFLTAMGALSDRLAGLQGGGDDYLVKPVDSAELSARVHVLAKRRTRVHEATVLTCGDLKLDRLQREVRRADRPIALLPREYQLLEFLLLSRGQPVTRTMLLEQVWGFRFDPRTNIVETHMSRLRGKLEAGGAPPLIRTIRGAGYVIQDA